MTNAVIFYDPIHVKKNLAKAMPAHEKASCMSKYDKVRKAPTKERCDEAIAEFSLPLAKYLGKFEKESLFFAYSPPHGGIRSS